MGQDTLIKHTRIDLVKRILLQHDGGRQPIAELAEQVIEKLDHLDRGLINPPKQPKRVLPYGDAKSQKVVEALIEKPEVLYGVLGVLHNMNVAGPWEHHGSNTGEFWFRRNARSGGHVATITPLDNKRSNTQVKWEIQEPDPGKPPVKQSAVAVDLPTAMAEVDVYLGVEQGFILVPGWKEG